MLPTVSWRLIAILVVTIVCGTATLAWTWQESAPIGPPLPNRFAGVNFAGGEAKSKRIPGRYGYDYSYPDAKIVRPFLGQGLTAARLPFRWERLQPVPMEGFDAKEQARLDRALDTLKGYKVIILDVHNYARRDHTRLDRPPASAAWLADLWARLAKRYKDDPRIAFGIMNEPFGIAATDWRAIAEPTVAAIRQAGARNLVLVPGTRWTGAHSWASSGNATAMAGFRDPGNNFAFELHQYLDSNSSGTNDECVSPEKAAGRLAGVTEWLRREKARGVLAEFGGSAATPCLQSLDALLGAMDAAPDVWLGWTYWAAGGRWGSYGFSVQPKDGQTKPQTAVLLRHLPKAGP